jgi:hypothetical protein
VLYGFLVLLVVLVAAALIVGPDYTGARRSSLGTAACAKWPRISPPSGMTPATLLAARFSTLRRKLDQAEEALKNAGLPQTLRDMIGAKMNVVRQQIEDQSETGGWAALKTCEKDAQPLFREALAWLQALNAPRWEVVRPLLAMAYALLEELCHTFGVEWLKLTIPDDEDSYSSFMKVIRLRFPLDGIWDLPVLAHEFGHYAANTDGFASPSPAQRAIEGVLDRYAPLPPPQPGVEESAAAKEERASAEAARAKINLHLNELFADVLAAYALGPSYGFTTMLLRFDPLHAREDDPQHPAAAIRAFAILDTLRRLDHDQRDRAKKFTVALARIQDDWNALLTDAGQGGAQELEPWVRYAVMQFYNALHAARPGASYATWDRADQLYGQLKRQRTPARLDPASLRDLLNAAWLARRDPSVALETIDATIEASVPR